MEPADDGTQAPAPVSPPNAAPAGSAVPSTGDPTVDEAITLLAEALDASLEEQLPVLERVHRTLQDRLADVEG